jgi:hypothetical protein
LLVFQLISLLLLTAGVSFGPGWFIVRRFPRWTALERLTASIALSLTLFFAASFTVFWMGGPAWLKPAITTIFVGCTLAAVIDARSLWRQTDVRLSLISFALLAAWTILLLSLIRQYGGGDICCDWLEHYERTQHFVEPWHTEFMYIGRYLLPARPPLMNAVAGHLLPHVGVTFAAYQVLYSFLNCLLLFPCCLVARQLGWGRRPVAIGLVAVVLATNPLFYYNATFAWTKVFTAFFVLVGVALYIAGLRRRDSHRTWMAFMALAASVVTHYSAAPFLAVVGLHHLIATRALTPARLVATARLIAAPTAVVALWVVYVISVYGPEGMTRNPSFEGTRDDVTLGEDITTRLLNLRDTFVPHPYGGYNGYPADATLTRRTLDTIIMQYGGNALISIGVVNAIFAMVLVVPAWRRARGAPGERRLWILIVACVWIIGSLLHGDRNPMGLAMITLQPVTYLVLAFVVSQVPRLPGWARLVWVGGMLVDLTLGVALNVWFQSTSESWAYTPNWDIKTNAGVLFFADHVTSPAIPLAGLVVIGVVALTFTLRSVRRVRHTPA